MPVSIRDRNDLHPVYAHSLDCRGAAAVGETAGRERKDEILVQLARAMRLKTTVCPA